MNSNNETYLQKEADFNKLALVYKECSLNYHYFLDWRFEIITRHAVLVGGVFVSIKFILDSGAGLFYIPYTLIILSIVSLCFLLMDLRHEKLSQGAADAASEIESILLGGLIKGEHLGFYDYQIKKRPKYFTHSLATRSIYVLSFILGIIGAYTSFAKYL